MGVTRRVLVGAFGIALVVLSWAHPVAAQEIIGIARVIDADTIEIVRQRIHLYGVDALEAGQTCTRGGGKWRCGREAMISLHEKIGRKPVRCLKEAGDRDEVIVAKCFFAKQDISEWLALNGWAVAKTGDGHDYARAEAVARSVGRGAWMGEFEMPWEWRQVSAR